MTDWNTFAAAEASGDRQKICELLQDGLSGEPAWKTLFYRAKYAGGTSFAQEGLDAYEKLSRMEEPDWWHRADAREALKRYRQPRLAFQKEDKFPLHPLGHKDSEILVPMNPSLVHHQGQLWVNLRLVDWYLDIASGSYGTRDPKGHYRTKNLLGPYDNGSTEKMDWLKVDHPPKVRDHHVRGFEDCRYFSFQGRLGFVGLGTRTHPEHTHKLSLGWIDGTTMTQITPLRLTMEKRTQKNWLPFVYQDQIHLVYQYSPFEVLRYEDGKVTKVISKPTFPGWSDFCGGAAPIPFEDGWLMVIHTLSYRNNNTALRTYWHRFLWLDAELTPTKVSREFRLACNDIEYVSGLVSHSDLIGLGYGYRDREARIRWVHPDTISQMLFTL